jgi:tRNA threonylcarbamoyladenosine biosynthesis protein TsaE
MNTIQIKSLAHLTQAARSFISKTAGNKKFAFYGPMGSGKTTFIKSVCKELGAVDIVTSPTFALINEYHTDDGTMFYHFDLYRINSAEELFDIGYEEYFYSDGFLFIEWPEKAEALLPDDIIRVEIEAKGEQERLVRIGL